MGKWWGLFIFRGCIGGGFINIVVIVGGRWCVRFDKKVFFVEVDVDFDCVVFFGFYYFLIEVCFLLLLLLLNIIKYY